MHIALLCATERGCRFLKHLMRIQPQLDVVVFSFREEPWEPPFLDNIRAAANDHGCQFIEARQVGHARLQTFWESTAIDLMLAVGWRYMIPSSIYRRPQKGAFIFHDSLLPQYRGFAPTVWAMVNGENQTGVTLFKIAEEVDAGDIVDQQRVPIGPDDTISDILEIVTQTYLHLLEKNLPALLNGTAPYRPQDHSRATFTCKRMPTDNRIDWSWPTDKIYNLIRASTIPYPGAYTYLSGKRMRVWSAVPIRHGRHYVGRVPGRVVEVRKAEGSVVLTGDDSLLLTRVQLDDGEILCAADLLKSLNDTIG